MNSSVSLFSIIIMSYDHNHYIFYVVVIRLEPMFNPNDLLSQKVGRYLDQGRALKEIGQLMRAAHLMAYFDLSKLNSA